MKADRLDQMVKGWFVGAFEPSVLTSDAMEVGVKQYAAGDHEERHFHRVATEITVIVSGTVRMFDREWGAGDIITIVPGEATDFLAITDTVTVVVKSPGALNDKYLSAEHEEGAAHGV